MLYKYVIYGEHDYSYIILIQSLKFSYNYFLSLKRFSFSQKKKKTKKTSYLIKKHLKLLFTFICQNFLSISGCSFTI